MGIIGVTRACRFNEAAGIPRGRPQMATSKTRTYNLASMRPRVFPAEDVTGDPSGIDSAMLQ